MNVKDFYKNLRINRFDQSDNYTDFGHPVRAILHVYSKIEAFEEDLITSFVKY